MLDKALASLGIGAAKVDARLDSSRVAPGQPLTGTLVLRGGKVDQAVRGIDLHVETPYLTEVGDSKVSVDATLGSFRVAEAFTLAAGEERRVPFRVQLPYSAPLTLAGQRTWLRTGLDVEMAFDPKDRDEITVVPTPLQDRLLQAMQALGFQLRSARCEKTRRRGDVPFEQEIEMVPTGGPFRGRLDEIDVVVSAGPGRIDVLLEVDRRARDLGSLLSEAMGTDESRLRLSFDESRARAPISAWASEIQARIERYS